MKVVCDHNCQLLIGSDINFYAELLRVDHDITELIFYRFVEKSQSHQCIYLSVKNEHICNSSKYSQHPENWLGARFFKGCKKIMKCSRWLKNAG